MSDLPLFPLHTVLFPHTPIQLHIFEDRYQRMIEMCLQEKRPFGVVLIRRGAEALGPLAEPCTVGCTADIIVTQPLGGGSMNLVALGGERFHIRSLDTQSHPYLTGRIEPYPWRMPVPGTLARRSEVLRSQVHRYLDFLVSQRGSDTITDAQKLPDDELIPHYHDPEAINIVVVGGETSPVWKTTDYACWGMAPVDYWRPGA